MNFLKGLISALLLSMTFVFACGSVSAQSFQSISVGPEIGAKVSELNVVDNSGVNKRLNDLRGQKGLVIVFFRSADWCPFCKKHLIELNQVAEQVKSSGFNMVGISYDSPEIMKSFAEMNNLNFDLLSDVDAQTVKQFGILNKDYQEGHRFYGIPYPGVMVISPEGKLEDKYFFEGYRKRITAEMLLSKLRG